MTARHLSEQQKNEVVSQASRMVRRLASKMAANLPTYLEKDDILQDAMVGLLDAASRFDPSKGIRFQTYAACRVRGAILDGLRNSDWASRGARHRARHLQAAQDELMQMLGRMPSTAELARHLSLTPAEVSRRKQEVTLSFVSSLNQTRGAAPDSEETMFDTLVDHTVWVEELASKAGRRAMIKEALMTLQERERLVLSLYYFKELTIRQVGEILGVSEARVSQIHSNCIKRVRKFLGESVRDLACCA